MGWEHHIRSRVPTNELTPEEIPRPADNEGLISHLELLTGLKCYLKKIHRKFMIQNRPVGIFFIGVIMQQRSEETHGKILAVSEELFASQGYDTTGVAEICRSAGIIKGAFYHHFPSKKAVFQALLAIWLAQLDQQLDLTLASSQNIPDALISMAQGTGPLFEAAESHIRIILEFWIQAGRQPELWKSTVAPYHHYIDQFSTLFVQAVKAGSFSPELNPRSSAHLVVALAMGMLLQSFFDPNGESWSQITRDGMQILITGMKGREL
jgi:AcrR family transcriptional regulator